MVRELDDDQAVVAMVDSNLHRENLKPSEKAFAYKMKLDAMKHQGKRLPEVSSLDDGAEVLADNEAMVAKCMGANARMVMKQGRKQIKR